MAMPNGGLSPWGQARLRARLDPGARFQMGRRVRRRVGSSAARSRAVVPRQPKFPYHFANQPNRLFAKLKYVVHEAINGPGAGAAVHRQYRANGMYDPEVAVGGHQPYGFDQIMAKYNHFTVLKATCTVTNQNTVINSHTIAVLSLYNESGVPAAAFAAGGSNGLRELPIQSKELVQTTGHYTQSSRSATLYADFTKIFGKPAFSMIGDSRFQGSEAADPSEDSYFGLSLYSPAATDLSAEVNYLTITIVYFACFTEPRWFTTS